MKTKTLSVIRYFRKFFSTQYIDLFGLVSKTIKICHKTIDANAFLVGFRPISICGSAYGVRHYSD